MSVPLRIEGYAIVSADGMIADAHGGMDAIRNAADQAFLDAGLTAAALLVHGRNSHEGQPNSPRRKRLIATRVIERVAPHASDPQARLWNPEAMPLAEAAAAFGVTDGVIAVIGGTSLFGMFLPHYDAFHLSCAERARLPGGIPLFPGIPPATPDSLLRAAGLHPEPKTMLDPDAGVSLVHWRRRAT